MKAINPSSKFEEALVYASIVHARQTRKGTRVPYLAHLLGVASIVLEFGADEDEAIGALLHDAGEDQGGKARIDDIRVRFGDKVADIVQGCSDTLVVPKPSWRKRKEDYVAHLSRASASVRLVSAADKLHNAQSILRDHRDVGEAVWSRFSAKKGETAWFYRAVVEALRQADANRLVVELDRSVKELECIASAT